MAMIYQTQMKVHYYLFCWLNHMEPKLSYTLIILGHICFIFGSYDILNDPILAP
jgi:hypothetical protein